ncbi:MAG: hypothetical protein MI976_02655 [Pseudomonadales bacterium]|nr:hypothetical protein [Pseudomonadales bacterium]
MGICGSELLECIIRPTLQRLGVYNPIAEQLLLGTAAAQSELGFYLNSSHGIGVFGIDKNRHETLWDEYLAFDADLASEIRGFASQHEFLKAPDAELACNIRYATAIAWMIYREAGIDLKKLHTEEDLANCWYELFAEKSPERSPEDFLIQYEKLFADCNDQAA